MSHSAYAAAVERITIEMASELLCGAPSANTVRTYVHAMLSDDEALAQLERRVNEVLVSRLPKSLLKSKLPGAMDVTEIPYHGEDAADNEYVRRSRPQHGTSHFHCYGTLCVVKRHKRYTLAVVLVRRGERMVDVVKRLLTGRQSYQTTYERRSKRYGTQELPLFIVCKYSQGLYKRQGICRFAYVVIGTLKMLPAQVYQEYRRRFGIETSYRLMNTLRARTTTMSVHLRLFWVALALLLLNLWTLRQMDRSLPPSARAASGTPSLATSRSLAPLALGNRQAAPGFHLIYSHSVCHSRCGLLIMIAYEVYISRKKLDD